LWWSSLYINAINLYYLYLAGNLMFRPLVEAFGAGAGAGSGTTAAFGPPPTRRFLTVFDGALCEAFRLGLFACCETFCEVAAS
jgi:hypothetical protein